MIVIVIVIGLSIALGWRGSSGDVSFEPASFAATVGAVWYTYLGWQDVELVAEQLHEPRRDLPVALFGTVALTMVLALASACRARVLARGRAEGGPAAPTSRV